MYPGGGLWGPRPPGVTKGVPKIRERKGKEEREREKRKKRKRKEGTERRKGAPFKGGFKVGAGGAPSPFPFQR